MDVWIDKPLEKKSWLFVRLELFELYLANTHSLPIFFYQFSVLILSSLNMIYIAEKDIQM